MTAEAHGNRRQLTVLGLSLLLYAFLALASYAWLPLDQAAQGAAMPPAMAAVPRWQLGLANAGIVLLVYGALGLVGYWLARKVGLPGIYRRGAGWRAWFWRPLAIGAIMGVVLVIGDQVFVAIGGGPSFPHPAFPLSIVASATAGIGEEVLFRLFVMTLWAFLLNLVLRRWRATGTALWIGNIIGALAFAAGHLPTAMILFGASTPAQVPPWTLAELVVLNGAMGLVAGQRHRYDGLVAAMGVHFWADVVWHVIWPLLGL